ncbi:MAG: HAMP domain-containing histidine kinase [Treponema sp.]|nr:HAMP domain-containing histidine kinase [Treponema sp.]
MIIKNYRGGGQSFNEEIFYKARRELVNIGDDTKDADMLDMNNLKDSIENVQGQFQRYAVFFALYDNEEWIIPPPGENDPLFDTLVLLTGNHTLSFDTTIVYVHTIGTAKAMVINYDFHFIDDAYIRYVLIVGVALVWIMIMLVLATNFFLTRMIITNISAPLTILSFGVKQIQENNVSFRLEYQADDEFLPVCDAFNEMAARLESISDERKKYEENRRELIAGISHDLRTPLASIKAYLEGLEKGVASTQQMRKKYLTTIKNKTHDLEHIINHLFLFSKLDINDFPLNLKTIDMRRLISDMVSELSGEYVKRGLTVELSETAKKLPVNIDPVLFRNVIVNILENSATYKEAEHGRIEIKTGMVDNMVKIGLTDDGPGVPEEVLDKLFDVFYRVDQSRNTKGNGLGLAISQKIVNRMGGSMQAELAERGLSIRIYLPLADEAAL